jgi:dihydrodipicolinate synthase/N-acetylneuraminate lyase/fructosamine-3-kinase
LNVEERRISQINGVICNTVSFYNQSFEFIKELNSILIRHILTNEANSILLFGNQAQKNLFSTTERIKLIELVSEVTDRKIPILVKINGDNPEDLIDQIENLSKKFEFLNFMISPPISEKKSIDQLKAYFENILGTLTSKLKIFLINNPPLFAGNDIQPNLLKTLKEFSNLKGINDSCSNIKNCKAYIENLSSNFTVICGMEQNFQTFLQLIPINMRKYSAILSNLTNLANVCSKLYYYALEDNILELLQLQEHINDTSSRLYEIKPNEINKNVAIKYAFLHIYKDLLSRINPDINDIYNQLQTQIDPIRIGRIEATVKSLLNSKQIYRLYFLGKKQLYQFDEIIKTFSKIDVLVKQGKVKKIRGPFTTNLNTIYRVNFEKSELIFRFRTNQYLQTNNIVKEKLLFPFLDKSLNPKDINLRQKVKEIFNLKTGSHFFTKEKSPIIPVYDLVYYDETKEIIPYIFSVEEYIRGKPLFQLINKYLNEGKNISSTKFLDLFSSLGELLGNLHKIQFDSFYNNIINIGKKKKGNYHEYFELKLEKKIQEASKNKLNFCDDIKDYYRKNSSLIEDETEFVLLHNDFRSQNIIVKEELGVININGIIDFDNWCVGDRAQDFTKIDYWILKPLNNPSFNDAFYNAYSKFYSLNKDFIKKIELHKLLWLLNEYNVESELTKKSDQVHIITGQPNSLENYVLEMKAIIQKL